VRIHSRTSPMAAALTLPESDRLASVFKALADPTRLRILAELAAGEQCVHAMAEALEMNQPAVSHQLRLLKDRGLVRQRRAGRHVFYALDDKHVYELFSRAREHLEHD